MLHRFLWLMIVDLRYGILKICMHYFFSIFLGGGRGKRRGAEDGEEILGIPFDFADKFIIVPGYLQIGSLLLAPKRGRPDIY